MAELSDAERTRKRRKLLYGAGFLGSVGVSLALVGPFVTPAFRRHCLPYLPATDRTISLICAELQGAKGPLIDLGSGDGRVVIAAAKHTGLPSKGIELNLWLVLYSKYKALVTRTPNASFNRADLWKTSLSPYRTVLVFGGEDMMSDLGAKLHSELTPDTDVISCRFPIPGWTPVKEVEDGHNNLWVYKKE